MKSLLALVALVLSHSAHASLQKLSGFDVRDKSTRYEVGISRENAILEERKVEVYKIQGNSKVKIKDFDVVYIKEDMNNDIDAVYASSEGTLQFGRMKKDPRTNRQGRVVTVKLDPNSDERKTLVFEASASLE